MAKKIRRHRGYDRASPWKLSVNLLSKSMGRLECRTLHKLSLLKSASSIHCLSVGAPNDTERLSKDWPPPFDQPIGLGCGRGANPPIEPKRTLASLARWAVRGAGGRTGAASSRDPNPSEVSEGRADPVGGKSRSPTGGGLAAIPRKKREKEKLQRARRSRTWRGGAWCQPSASEATAGGRQRASRPQLKQQASAAWRPR